VDGQTVFYPYGILGNGWVVEEPALSRLAAFTFRWLLVSCVVLAAYMTLLVMTDDIEKSLIFCIPAYIVILFIYFVRIRRFTRDLEAAPARLTLSDAAKNQARLYPKWLTSLLYRFAAIMLAASVVSLVISLWHPGSGTLKLVAALVFFSVCFLHISKIRNAQKQSEQQAPTP
jgi:hypothetical protein